MQKKDVKIGFIGQGWIGRNYANDFEKRGYNIVRYGLEEKYTKNKDKIKECDVVFIAVPTPTKPDGFDDSILKAVIKKVGKGSIAVIKSTVLPGTTRLIQAENPGIFVMHSPEFLREASAKYDVANPNRNIIGIPEKSEEYVKRAKNILSFLPKAPYEDICSAEEAEIIKYGGNNFFYIKVVFINMLYDFSKKMGCDWETVKGGMIADPRIGISHMNPIHKSGTNGEDGKDAVKLSDTKNKEERGAGGHCFIKDFEAFIDIYQKIVKDKKGVNALQAIRNKNLSLLFNSGKDLDLLRDIYGEDFFKK
jgi:hypothetical protein